jgi:hypothetical protein
VFSASCSWPQDYCDDIESLRPLLIVGFATTVFCTHLNKSWVRWVVEKREGTRQWFLESRMKIPWGPVRQDVC